METPSPHPDDIPEKNLRWSGMTQCGPVRSNNEDAFLAFIFDGHEIRYLGKTGEASTVGHDFIFAVSDGMGGAKSGEFASRITVEKISHLIPLNFKVGTLKIGGDYTNLLREIFAAIHHALLKLGQSYEECRGMGSTLSLCWFSGNRLTFCHVGDSRIYHLPAKGDIRQLTDDHTQPGWLRRQGKISEREARTHPSRNALHQALGASNQFVDPQLGTVTFYPGDRFVLCTDGLIDGLWDFQIEEIARQSAATPLANRLVSAALERSGRDNTTALAVETFLPTHATNFPDGSDGLTRLFVYGTLKKGCENHALIEGQTFIAPARTTPGYTLYSLGSYPAMVRDQSDRLGVSGEIWAVDKQCLEKLDHFEGVPEGLYSRVVLPVASPQSPVPIQTYLYLQNVGGLKRIGDRW